jgi:hypothetical protein
MKKILVSQKDLGMVIDVTPKWIQELSRRGVFKKKAGRYDLQESVKAYVIFLRGSRDKTLAEAQRLHLEAKAKKLQLEIKKLEGSLVPRTDQDKKIESLVAGCEQNFRDLPWRLTPVLCQVAKMENEEKIIALILRHGIGECWRDLAGISRKETPIVLPGEAILVCLGLIRGDKNGEVIMYDRRVKVVDLLEKYGSGIDSLKIQGKENGKNEEGNTNSR